MTLNEKIALYQDKRLALAPLRDDIALTAYRYLRSSRYAFSDDEIGDCLCSLLEKIPDILNRYRVTDAPFEAYLFKTCKLSVFNRRREARGKYIPADAKEIFSPDENYGAVGEEAVEFGEAENRFISLLRKTMDSVMRKHDADSYFYRLSLLIVLLKSGYYLNAGEKEKIYEWGQFDRKTVERWLSHLHASTERARNSFNLCEIRRNRYAALLCAPNPERRNLNINIVTERLRRWNNKLTSIKRAPKNIRIAELLNIECAYIDRLFARVRRLHKRTGTDH